MAEKQEDGSLRKIELLADALDLPVFSVSHLFGKHGIPLTSSGEYNARDFVRMLEGVFRMAEEEKKTPPSLSKALWAIHEMGETVESGREWAEQQFRDAGFLVRREESSLHGQICLERPDDHTVTRVLIYVALTVKQTTGQTGFTLSGINRRDISWYALISRPFGRMDLRQRPDIKKHQRGTRANTDVGVLTISPGDTKYSFENVLPELRRRNASWWKERDDIMETRAELLGET
jgi:hypothetical protein